jgi:periplasmic protein TonB
MDRDGRAQARIPRSTARGRVATAKPYEGSFWIALACATVMHALCIAGFLRSLPRQMGERDGNPEGVSVEMVDAASLASRNTMAKEARPASLAAPARPFPKEAMTVPEEQKKGATPRATDRQTPALVSPPDEGVKQDEVHKEQKPDVPAWPIDLQALKSDPAPDRIAKPKDPNAGSKNAAKPPEQQPRRTNPPLQLSLPDAPVVSGSRDTAFTRPAGITRSGENDEFGRAVIRALRKTMPALDRERGRVTVRFLLSRDGNLVELHLAGSSGDPVLDQSVMFAVRQSSFPFPPANAPLVDRTFLITYIYR